MLLEVGVDPKKIVYGTSIKPAEHIRLAHQAGVDRFAADSKEEVKKIAEHAPGAKVFIRTIVEDTGSVFMMSERFGTPPDTVKDMLLYARSLASKHMVLASMSAHKPLAMICGLGLFILSSRSLRRYSKRVLL